MKHFFLAATAVALAAPLAAQTSHQGMNHAMPAGASMTAADVGVAPITGTTPTDYVKMAADSDLYEMQSSRLALSKSKRADVKGFAREMIADHTTTSKALMAALRNGDRTIAKPSTRLSADNAAKIALLKRAPKDSFDNLYLQQQMQAHQTAWALHKGFATDGADASLRQVAATAVPIIERHVMHAKQMAPASMSSGM
ncbi:MAG TPA: DUF4142 domain-containing protein [Sphingomonas sp.]|jgi:putative membrane protein|uniref:DUF4142 domain-containing protein n=1 Tax=Sphingomonas sp. TaxID=28214 RepID=UPI002ED7922B